MDRAQNIYTAIADVCSRIGRVPKEITLVGASKVQSPETVNEFIAFENAQGRIAHIGENYVQEWEKKASLIKGDYRVHCIGHLQSNKAKKAVELFTVIQSVDSIKLAEKLSQAAQSTSKIIEIFLQINISADEAKFGIGKDAVIELCKAVHALPSIQLMGLMTIPRLYEQKEEGRKDYKALAALSRKLPKEFFVDGKCELSMGMSDDFDIAIEEGATYIRVGSRLFGARS